MIEAEVQAAFVKYLNERGWKVVTDNPDYTDVIARRGAELLVAEVKGTTTLPGLDVDTAYGQLLRRMRDRPEESSIRLGRAGICPKICSPRFGRSARAARNRCVDG